MEDLENAYIYYLKRSQQKGVYEETYESFFRLGRVTERLSEVDEAYTWQMAQEYYFEAHRLMPHRAEPFVRLAEHYWPNGQEPRNAALCYLYAKRAYELPYPENDWLFIYPYAYNFLRYELLSKSAWQVGDFGLGEVCTRKALAYREAPHLLRNLAYYVEANRACAVA